MKYYKKILLLLAFSSCANPLPPSGGPPDTTPPEIVGTEPANGAINWNSKSLFLKFSKYMNKLSVNENISISPLVKMNYDWSGKTLEIEFAERLDSNTTYALILGTDYTDIKNNKPSQSYSLIFSTGPKIDSGTISGKLYDAKPDGAYIFAYKIDNLNPDTLNPNNTLPHYRIQVGNSGNFTIPALKDGKYRLFAVRDKFKDGIYSEGVDQFCSAFSDADVIEGKSQKVLIKLGPTIDSQKPMLYEVEAVSNQRIIAFFSEEIEPLSLEKSLFLITDSLGEKQEENLLAVYPNPNDKKAVEIILSQKLSNQSKYKLTIQSNSYYQIRDTAGNPLNDTANKSFFYGNNIEDTLQPAIFKLPFRDSTLNINPYNSFIIIFNTAVEKYNFDKKIEIKQKNEEKAIQCEIYWQNPNIVEIKPMDKLKQDAWYKFTLRCDSLKSILGKFFRDTTYTLNFKTADYKNYGAVSGRITNPTLCNGNYVVVLKNKVSKEELTTMASSDGNWNFEEVEAGEWNIEVYCDENGDMKYNYGRGYPFAFSEKFYIFENIIKVKPRWKVEGIVLSIE